MSSSLAEVSRAVADKSLIQMLLSLQEVIIKMSQSIAVLFFFAIIPLLPKAFSPALKCRRSNLDLFLLELIIHASLKADTELLNKAVRHRFSHSYL